MKKDTKLFLAILVFTLLVTVLITLFFMPGRQKQRTQKKYELCARNLKAIHAALLKYKEKKGAFPSKPDTEGLLPVYKETLHDLTFYVCPGTITHTRGELRDDTLSYYYFPAGENPQSGLPAVTDHAENHEENHAGIRLGISWGGELRAFRVNGSGRDAVLKAWNDPSLQQTVPSVPVQDPGSRAAE